VVLWLVRMVLGAAVSGYSGAHVPSLALDRTFSELSRDGSPSPRRDMAPMTAKKLVLPAEVDARGAAMIKARNARLEQERRLAEVRNRVEQLKTEQSQAKAEISDANERTKQRKDLSSREGHIKQVLDDTRKWMSVEEEHRRQEISEQRKLSRQAIEAKRLALLESRHADYVSKKEEAAKARVTILQSRAAKQQQKQVQMQNVRERQSTARTRIAAVEKDRQQALHAKGKILQEQEDAEVKQSLRELEFLAKEEERLLQSVHKQNAQHRKDFDDLTLRLPKWKRGLTNTPAPLALPQPLPPDSPLLSRLPATSLGEDRTDSIGRFPPNTPSQFPPSPDSRFCGHYGQYGSSAPSSPRSLTFGSRPPTSGSHAPLSPLSARSDMG